MAWWTYYGSSYRTGGGPQRAIGILTSVNRIVTQLGALSRDHREQTYRDESDSIRSLKAVSH